MVEVTETREAWQKRMEAKARARALIVNQIAEMLWESGPQSSDWDGGCPPSWGDITEGRQGKLETSEINEAYSDYWRDTWRAAEAILALDHKQCFVLAALMVDEGRRKTDQLEIDLWHKIERAAGYELGSLTGKEGVKQRIFI